jgi:NTP pyrophosphatase (non-canonical NTP hydrolase)
VSLQQYQKAIDDELQQYEKPYWHPLSQFARMVEEVGEVGRILNDTYGDKPRKVTEAEYDLEEELGDILYTVICLANTEQIDLDNALQRAKAKLSTRDKDRFKKKNP